MWIAVCDDDRAFLEQLSATLNRWSEGTEHRINVFTDGDALLQAHMSDPFDVIILDMVMPLLSGIDTAKEIRQMDKLVKIIFITSSPEFALESYTVKATNYLLKPLDTAKLVECMDELDMEFRKGRRSIAVKSNAAVHRIELDSIEYLEAQNKKVLFSLTDGRVIETGDPLYVFEDLLNLEDGFYKCSRSYIVNIHRIDTYTLKEVKMRSGYRIPISRKNQKEFENTYFSVTFGKAGDMG